MRVAHICEQLVRGGIESMITDLCAASRPVIGSRVYFLYGRDERGLQATLDAAPVGMLKRLRLDPRGLLRLRQMMARFEPDVIHCHTYYSVVAALLLRHTGFRRPPIVYTVHAGVVRSLQRSDRVIEYAVRNANRVVAVSPQSAATVQEFTWGAVAPKVILNGIDLRRMEVGDSFVRNEKRREFGAGESTRIFLMASFLGEPKDHPTLFRAFAELLREVPDSLLLIAGDGPSRRPLEESAKAFDPRGRIRLLGRRDDIHELLAISDAFVLSSRSEGMPISILEAACAGVPVIATKVGGIPDLEREGVVLRLAEPGDPASLLDALRTAASRDLEAVLARGRREFVRRRFSMDEVARQYQDIYSELMYAPLRRSA